MKVEAYVSHKRHNIKMFPVSSRTLKKEKKICVVWLVKVFICAFCFGMPLGFEVLIH